MLDGAVLFLFVPFFREWAAEMRGNAGAFLDEAGGFCSGLERTAWIFKIGSRGPQMMALEVSAKNNRTPLDVLFKSS